MTPTSIQHRSPPPTKTHDVNEASALGQGFLRGHHRASRRSDRNVVVSDRALACKRCQLCRSHDTDGGPCDMGACLRQRPRGSWVGLADSGWAITVDGTGDESTTGCAQKTRRLVQSVSFLFFYVSLSSPCSGQAKSSAPSRWCLRHHATQDPPSPIDPRVVFAEISHQGSPGPASSTSESASSGGG